MQSCWTRNLSFDAPDDESADRAAGHAARALQAQSGVSHACANVPRSVATYLFAWNPSLIFKWPELPDDVRRVARRGHLDTRWNAGRARSIEPGSRAFLVRVGVEPRGLFGAGYVLTAPVTGPHWSPEKLARGAVTNFVDLRLDQLFELPPLTYADLAVPPFGRFRWGVRSSGTRVPTTLADALEDLWERNSQGESK